MRSGAGTSRAERPGRGRLALVALVALAGALVGCYPPVGPFDRYVAVAYQDWQIPAPATEIYSSYQNAAGEEVPLFIDVFGPPRDGRARPAVIIAHGGGFYIGNRTVHHPVARAFAQLGFVVATPEYSLVPPAPDQRLDTAPGLRASGDIQYAVQWLRARADTYGIDPDRVAVLGGSSGGVPALLAAQTTDLTGGRHDGPESHIPNAVYGIGTTLLPTLVTEGHIRSDTVAAPALLHHYQLDNVSGSTDQDIADLCGVWSSGPTLQRCSSFIFPGEGHVLYFFPWDQIARDTLLPFLHAELDLANAAAP